ncbi:MAG TPA: hypothetical protein PKW80_10460 [Bacteroidales bacterium]|nr:hypothetical protein [Bacteroidales bacterium]
MKIIQDNTRNNIMDTQSLNGAVCPDDHFSKKIETFLFIKNVVILNQTVIINSAIRIDMPEHHCFNY